MNLSSFIPHSTYAQQGPEPMEGKSLSPRRFAESFEQVLFQMEELENRRPVASALEDVPQEEPEAPGPETIVDADMPANTEPVDSDQSRGTADVSPEPLNRSIRNASRAEVIVHQVRDGSVPGADGPTVSPVERPASGRSGVLTAVAASTTWRAEANITRAGDQMQTSVVMPEQTDLIVPRSQAAVGQSEPAAGQSDTGSPRSLSVDASSSRSGVQDPDMSLRHTTMTVTSAQADPSRVNESLNQEQVHSDVPQTPVTHREPALRGTLIAASVPAEMVTVGPSTEQSEALGLSVAEGRLQSAGSDATARSDASGQYHAVDETDVSAPCVDDARRGASRELQRPARLNMVAATPAPVPLTNEPSGAVGHSPTANLSATQGATQINRSLPPELSAQVPLESPPTAFVPKSRRDVPSAAQSQPAKLDSRTQTGQSSEPNPINTDRFRGESAAISQPLKFSQRLSPEQATGMTEQPARPTENLPKFARQLVDGIEQLSVQSARDGDTVAKLTEPYSSTARPLQHLIGGSVPSDTGGDFGGQLAESRTARHKVSIAPATNSPHQAAILATAKDVSVKGTADRPGLVLPQVETRSGVGSLSGNLKLESRSAESAAQTRQTENLAPRRAVSAPEKTEAQKPVVPPESDLANPQHDKIKVVAKNDRSAVLMGARQMADIRSEISRTTEAERPVSGAASTNSRISSSPAPSDFGALVTHNIGQAAVGSVFSSSSETPTATVALPGANVPEISTEITAARIDPRRRHAADRTQSVSQGPLLTTRAQQAEPRSPFQGSAPAALAQPVSDHLSVSRAHQKGEFEDFISDHGSVLRADGPQSSGAGATHSLGVSRTDFGRHVAAQVIDVLPSRADRPVEISLNPEELGRVRMTVITGDSGVTLSIVAERPETLDLLRRHIDQLATELRRLGYESPSFEFSGSDSGQRGSDQDTDAHTGVPMTTGETDELPPTTTSPPEPTATPARAASGLDLRV